MKKILLATIALCFLPSFASASPLPKKLVNIKPINVGFTAIEWPNKTQSVLAKFNVDVSGVSTWSLGTVALYLDGATKPVYTKPMGYYQKIGTSKETAIGVVLKENLEVGTHGAKLCLNYKHTVKETTYDDNCVIGEFTVDPFPAGDLIVQSPSVSLSDWKDGKKLLSFKAEIKNIGNLKINHLPLVTMQLGGTVYKYKIYNDAVKPNEVFFESQTAIIDPLAPQTYTAKFCVASGQGETNTDNNCASVDLTVDAPPAVPAEQAKTPETITTGADLSVSNVTYSNTLMKYTITNVGEKTFTGSIPVQYEFKRSSLVVTTSLTTTLDLNLAPGKTADISIAFRTNPNSTLGKFLYAPTGYPSIFQVTLHPAPELGELNESNNTGKSVFK